MRSAEVVVCGAGIAGIAAAHELATRHGVRDVVLVDDQPPLTVTSDKSTECYRDWWPQPAMAALMGRSIARLEELAAETGNAFAMNRNGYAYLSGTAAGAAALAAGAEATAALGAGPLRIHRGEPGDPPWPETPWERLDPGLRGADLTLEPSLVRGRFPFIAPDARALLHARRCGWVSAQQLGMVLLERAQAAGARLLRGRITGIARDAQGVTAVQVAGGEVERITTRTLVLAPGPELPAMSQLAGLDLPVFCELHAKVMFDDALGVVPRHLPLVIWNDPVTLEWSGEERRELAADPALAFLLGELPPAVHFRPEGGEGSRKLLLLWAFDVAPVPPLQPPSFPPWLAEVVVRGVARMVPAFGVYLERMRRPFVDGGYYTKVPDNRVLVGGSAVPGLWLLAALSGYGIMAAMGAAELLADHLRGAAPAWAPDLAPERFADAGYRERLLAGAAGAGQL
ncbi:MAG TPA: FAD-dependent oxidoreductase [Thermoanaerobaculia bacterium]|nr:FAD-dependent oxidoreductase [Thermoanaerobaculia bacterium]